ncbi:APC family permease [Conexibacter woesei]|uniref:APC family permease n=1 Tax=Conexibacter woesei TaxID=191495 RepID=UPI000423D6AC|nr:APC family permease [Conexibacter woesei]
MSEKLLPVPEVSGMKPPGLVPAAGPPGGAKYDQDLSRSLTFRENVLITLSAVTPASSVFVIVPSVINGVGGASALAFAIAALVGVAVALCYAELSSAFPITGGEYAFVARTLGKPVGFALFVLSLVSGVFVLGVIASGAEIYLGAVWPSLSGSWVGIVVVLVTAVVGCLNIRTNAWVTGVFLVIELAAVAVLSVLGFAHAHQPVSTLWTAQAVGDHGVLVSAGAGLMVSYTATALFAYNGYGTAVYYAEETRQATRTIGRAILWSLAITVAAELIPLTGVLLGTPSLQGLVGASDPMSYFLRARGGETVSDIVSVAIAIAIINAVLAIVLQMGRLVYSSARDRSWPDVISEPLMRVHPRYKTPVAATLLVGVVGALLLWLVSFHILLIVTSASLLITYGLVGIAAIVGRVRGATARAVYRMPGWPVIPGAMVVATIVVGYESWTADWVPVVVAAAIFTAGLPYYYLYLHPRRGDRWTLPAPADEELA